MKIEFDSAKNLVNYTKHGVYLSDAYELEWSAIVIYEDRRKHYNETRYIGYAPLNLRLFCVIFTVRNNAYRIISLRKANDRELARYEKTVKTNS